METRSEQSRREDELKQSFCTAVVSWKASQSTRPRLNADVDELHQQIYSVQPGTVV